MKLNRRERERLKAAGYLDPEPEISGTYDEVGPKAAVMLFGVALGYLIGVPLGAGAGFLFVILGAVGGYYAADGVMGWLRTKVAGAWEIKPQGVGKAEEKGKTEAEAEAETEAETESETAAEAESETETAAESGAESEAETETAAETETEAETEAETETETKAEAEAETEAEKTE